MKFVITMNMPARSGTAVHQVVADYPVKSLKEFFNGFLGKEKQVMKDMGISRVALIKS